MLYLFGCPRSGTTLLAQSLNCHSQILIPYETDFLVPVAFVFDRIADPENGRAIITKIITGSTGFRMSIGEYLTPQEIEEIVQHTNYRYSDVIEAIYEHIGRKTDTTIVGDKSPNDILFLRMIVKVGGLASDARIIHLVRDIRDVMVSLNEQQWVGDLDLYYPRFWSNANLYLYSIHPQFADRYLLVKYEQFCADPRAELRRVCRFLGVDFLEQMLNSENFHPRYRSMRHQTRLYQPISTDRIGVYRCRLSNDLIASYERQAREAMEVFGYTIA
jgi:hypothetical protein